MKTNILKKIITKGALVALAFTSLSGPRASAQGNPNYAPGDLLLYFIQFGGSSTAIINLGAAITYRNAVVNIPNIVNVSAQLTGAGSAGYPATWYEDPTIFWGLAGVRTDSTSTTHVNGDAGRTLYVSAVRTSVGTEGTAASAGWTVDSNGSMTTGASNIIAMNNRMETQSLTTTLVEGTSSSLIDDQNTFNILGTPTDSFGVFPGSVMGGFGGGSFGTLGGVAAEGALDLYRILAVSNGNTTEPGTIREGQFQGTFVIEQDGDVSYIVAPVPEPTTMGATLALGLVAAGMRRRRRATV